MHTTDRYYNAMMKIEAHERLVALSTQDWPNMKKSQREKLHKELHRAARPEVYEDPVTPSELAKILGAGRI